MEFLVSAGIAWRLAVAAHGLRPRKTGTLSKDSCSASFSVAGRSKRRLTPA